MITYLEAIRAALREEMAADPRVFVMGEDIGAYGGAFRITEGLLDEFGPDRVIDTPISESAIVGAAVGAAQMGLRPVCEMQFIDFVSSAYSVIVNFAAKVRYRTGAGAPLVIRGPCGAGVRAGPFHSQNAESYFANVPGLKLVAPATVRDAKGLLKAAIRDPDPVLFFEHKYLYRRVRAPLDEAGGEGGDDVVELGRARLHRRGGDLTIATFGAMVHMADEAARRLQAEDGAEVEIVDLRTLRPLDEEAVLASVRKTGRLLVLHEAPRFGGLGGEVAALAGESAFEWLEAPVRRLAAADTPVPYAATLEDAHLPSADAVVEVAREQLSY